MRVQSIQFRVFRNLSFFCLTSVTLLDKTVEHFLSKFPRLSELCMYNCVLLEDNFFVTKEEFKVEILSISDCMTTKSMVFPIYITAPNLMKYHFSGSCLDSCSIMGAHKLKDANIYIDSPVADQSQESLLYKLLNDLSHCQTLYLNSWCIQVIIYSLLLTITYYSPVYDFFSLSTGFGNKEV